MGRSDALVKAIEDDFKRKHPLYHKSRREGLTLLSGIMLETRTANLMELAATLPRDIGTAEDRYQYIVRQLKNEPCLSGCNPQPLDVGCGDGYSATP